jgi:hypothetical protein
MSSGATPAQLGSAPASDWMKGAHAAHRIVTAQVNAGLSPVQIADQWAGALAAYDAATATDAQREWHAGATHTARELIQTYRDALAAEAEQVVAEAERVARAARGQRGRGPEPEADREAVS